MSLPSLAIAVNPGGNIPVMEGEQLSSLIFPVEQFRVQTSYNNIAVSSAIPLAGVHSS